MKLRKAINDHCKSCCYDSVSGLGTWRKQVEDCPCTSCSLYTVRPKTLPKQHVSQAVEDIRVVSQGVTA